MKNQNSPRGLMVFIMILTVILASFISFPNFNALGANLLSDPTPTVTINLNFKDIENNYDTLKGNDWKNYLNSIKGTRVHWTAKVTGGDKDSIYLDMGQKGFRSIYLRGITEEQIPEGRYFEFEATIKDISKFLGFALWLIDPTIIQLLNAPPTATPIPSATIPPTFTNTPTNTSTPTQTPTTTPTHTQTPASSLILGKNANLRIGPGPNFKAKEVASKGDELQVYGRNEDGSWLLVDPVDQLWVQAGLATLNSPSTLVPVAPTITPTFTRTLVPTKTPRPTRTPVPTKTPRPTATKIPAVSINTIYDNLEKMTALQFNEYKKLIVGKPIREMVVIGNVSESGTVQLSGTWSPWLINISDFCVVVTGVPKEIAITLNGGESYYLEAIVNGIVGDYNYYYNCENTMVLSYRRLP